MSAGRRTAPRPALVQEVYHEAEVRLQEIGKAVRRSAEVLRLDAQEEYGVITQGEYADRMLALEEQAGWPEAHAERDACRAALLAWGMRQTRTQWGQLCLAVSGRHAGRAGGIVGPPDSGTAALPA